VSEKPGVSVGIQEENKPPSAEKIVVLGLGNLLLSDEGVGVQVVNKIRDMGLPPEVKIIDGGTEGFSLLPILMEAERLIIVDAVKGGGSPGSLYRFDLKDCPPFPDPYKTSAHQISFPEVISLARLIGPIPKATVIGVEPKSLEIGMELSSEIQAKIPRIIELVLEEV